MSYSIDVNVLLYASNSEATEHEAAREFLQLCAEDSELLCLCWPTLMTYLRMSTHPRLFMKPLTPALAMKNVESLLAIPHVRVINELEGFLSTYQQMTESVPVRGNLVPDAHLATILQQHGVKRLYTRNRDFLKFTWLDIHDPFEEPSR